jgi:predicted transcriptional regulator
MQRSHRATSKLAEQRSKHFRGGHKVKILEALERLPVGATFEQIAVEAGLTDSQTWKRLSELSAAGLIFDTGITRKLKSGSPGIVWQLTSRKEKVNFNNQSELFQ